MQDTVEAKQQATRLLTEANMLLFEVSDTLDGYTNGCFERELREIQNRLRDMTGAVNRIESGLSPDSILEES